MPRNRVTFNELNLFVGPSPATGAHFSSGNSGSNLISELSRIQSATLDWSLNRTEIREYGRGDRVDTVALNAPTVNLNFSYIPLDGSNEKYLGLKANDINASFISGLLTEATDSKNYFLAVSQPGVDDDGNGSTTLRNVVAVGNGYISNYTISAAVNQIPNVSVQVDALNVDFFTGTSNKQIPAVTPSNGQPITTWNFTVPVGTSYTGANIPAALRPGEIVMELPSTGALGIFISGENSSHLQSFSLSIPITRTDINKLGSLYDFAKPIQLPLTATLSLEALLTDIRQSSLANILCDDRNYNFRIRMKNPSCTGTGTDAIIIDFKQAKLVNQNLGTSLGGEATMSMTFDASVSASNSSYSGPSFSGVNGT